MNIQPMDIYKHLYNKGNHLKFDLTEEGKNCGFKYEKDMSVRSYEENEFTRARTFNQGIDRLELL